MKKTLNNKRENNLLEGVEEEAPIGIENIVITTPDHMAITEPEKRTARIQSMVTPTEKKELLDNMGRFKESDVLRELILILLDKPTNKINIRSHIINIMNKKVDRFMNIKEKSTPNYDNELFSKPLKNEE